METPSKTFAEMEISKAFGVRVAYFPKPDGGTRRAVQIRTHDVWSDSNPQELKDLFSENKQVLRWIDRLE